MKNKILAILFLSLAVVGSGLAQEKVLRKAKRDFSKQAFGNAATLIEQVIVHPETQGNIEAWLTRGRIYLGIARNPLLARDYPNAADLSKESFEKVLQLDPSDKNVIMMRTDISNLAGVFYDNGAAHFESKNFEQAVSDFENSLNLMVMEGVYDTNAAFNIALCASNANMLDKAIEYYKVLVDDAYPLSSAYIGLADAYFRNDQKDLAAEVIEKAVKAFPEEKSVYTSAASVYLRMGANEKAEQLLNTALSKWSEDAAFQLFIGIAYENSQEYDKAEAAYKKALELNPEYAEAIYNLGAFYVNKGIRIKDEANALPLEENEKYEQMDAQSKEVLRQALPYLQKVMAAQPQNLNVMMTLRDVYVQLGMMNEAGELRGKIEELQGN